MSFILHDDNGVQYHISTLLNRENQDQNQNLIHGFSTRNGGVSGGVYASLNLRQSGPEPDEPERVMENYCRFCAALGADPAGLVLSRQVHEDTVRRVTNADAGKGFDRPADYTADALITNEPGLFLTVFSADCIILLLWDPVTRSVGAVHAGWRGTALDLPAKTAGEMIRVFGAKSENIRVAVGAGIGPCCFETGDDVPDAMRRAFGSDSNIEKHIKPAGKKWFVDLKAINAWRLREIGVKIEHIDVCPLCTACCPDLYWSHRKMGEHRGLQGALIGMTGEAGL